MKRAACFFSVTAALAVACASTRRDQDFPMAKSNGPEAGAIDHADDDEPLDAGPALAAPEPPPEQWDADPFDTWGTACNEQPPQDFLIRKNFFPKWNADKDEAEQRATAHQVAIKYRTEHYGYYPGFGSPDMNPHPPAFYTKKTTWFGLDVVVHEKIIPVLACVEEEIKHACADHPYTPRALAGIRFKNTYYTGEITNHAYGIAMDIDPDINSCCGCVPPWNSNPLCHKQVTTEYERMSMPECWVHAFEKYGFYWLGHDVLQDTMHFEFLGDPDKILRDPPPAASGAADASAPMSTMPAKP
jgi:hypothetical protein